MKNAFSTLSDKNKRCICRNCHNFFAKLPAQQTHQLFLLSDHTIHCRKETARCCSYSGPFSLLCCCISFSSSYEYHVDFSTLPPQMCSIPSYVHVVQNASKMPTVLPPVSERKPTPWVLWNVTLPLIM